MDKSDLANVGVVQGVMQFYPQQNTFSLALIVRTVTEAGFLLLTGGVNPERVLRRPLAKMVQQGWTRPLGHSDGLLALHS